MNASDLKIGDTVYLFDSNRRVYPKNKNTQIGPIWREHWRPVKVTGETSRSWIIGEAWDTHKLPKKGQAGFAVAFSQEEIDRAAWVHDNAIIISHMVSCCKDYAVLKHIATLVGYKG